MSSIKDVIDYSGLDYEQVLDLPADVFLLMRKNKIIGELEKTEEGRKYLEDCKRFKVTECDTRSLKALNEGGII